MRRKEEDPIERCEYIHVHEDIVAVVNEQMPEDLVRNRREGKTVFYSLADGHIKAILSQGLDHIEEE